MNMKHYIDILPACLLSLLLWACTEETAIVPALTQGTINFTLSESGVVTTRSYDGSSDENFVSTLEVFFFDSTTKDCVTVQKLTVNGTPGSVVVNRPKNGTYDIYAIASYETGLTAGTATVEKLKELIDTRFVPDMKGPADSHLQPTASLKYLRSSGSATVDRPMPMTGVSLNQKFSTTPTIQLKRSMAKIWLNISAGSTFPGTILYDKISVRFMKVKPAAYLFPEYNSGSAFTSMDYPWAGYKNNEDTFPKDPTEQGVTMYAYLHPGTGYDFRCYLCVPYKDLLGNTHMENYYNVGMNVPSLAANTIYSFKVLLDGTGSMTDATATYLKSSLNILPWEETTVSGDIGGTYLKVDKTSLTITDNKTAVLNFETDASKVEIDWGTTQTADNLDRSVMSVTTTAGKGSIEFKWGSSGAPLTSFSGRKVCLIAGNVMKEVQLNYDFDVPSFSNCYIVKPGNSVYIPIRGPWAHWLKALGTSLPTDATLTVKVLWTSICGNKAPASDTDIIKSVTIPSGAAATYNKSIRVTAGATKGNGTVGLYVNGTLRWSWHIWVTDYNPLYDTVKFDMSSHFRWMNRNLGAMTNDPTDAEYGVIGTYGLYYQWGRKDPFIGPKAQDSWERSLYLPGSLTITDDGSVTADKATKLLNPATYYRNIVLSSDDWGGVTHKKSPYDPCPEGWRIPSNTASGVSPWDDLLGTPYQTTFEWNYSVPGSGKTYTNGCTLYGIWTDNSVRVCNFFPAAGYYDASWGEFYYAGSVGKYCIGTADDKLFGVKFFTLSQDNPKSINNSDPPSAYSVRCCRED